MLFNHRSFHYKTTLSKILANEMGLRACGSTVSDEIGECRLVDVPIELRSLLGG